MADKKLEEYRAYYDARAQRYADNPKKKHSYEAECKIRDLFYKYDSLEEIKQHFGSLNIECAFAKWRDQYEMESEYYASVQDPVHKKCADQILAEIENYPKTALSNSSILDMSKRIGEITDQNNTEVFYDESSGKALLEEWISIDEIEVDMNAVMPQRYKREFQSRAEILKKEMVERAGNKENNIQTWAKGKQLNLELVWEPRYRRLMPFSDADIKEHMAKYREFIKR